LALAEGRPEWMLWGKAQPAAPDAIAHPLLCHCVDVAAVAALFLTERLPSALCERLLSLHADQEQALRFLLLVIALHDLGKATPAFQKKAEWAEKALSARGLPFFGTPKEHHSDTGMFFLAPTLRELGVERRPASVFARCVTAHHGEFPPNRRRLPLEEQGYGEGWNHARRGVVDALASLFAPRELEGLRSPSRGDVMVLSGLASVADWVGSLQEVFSYEPPWPDLAAYWPLALERARRALDRAGFRPPQRCRARRFVELFPRYRPWPLHEKADVVAAELDEPSLVVIEAPMGEGKTEAALVLAEAAAGRLGQSGLFIGLPTRATANQMFGRARRFLEATRAESTTLLLAHGEASLVDAFAELRPRDIHDPEESGGTNRGTVRAEAWFASKKRALLGEHAVGTVDQALLAAMRVRHGFVRHFGLAGKTVLLDEVHAYDTYTGTLLDRLVEWLAAAGTSVVMLSATLPSTRRRQLVEAYQRGARTRGCASSRPDDDRAEDAPYPRVTVATAGRVWADEVGQRRSPTTVRLGRLPDDRDDVARRVCDAADEGGCIAWICNTVGRAQEAYRRVRELRPDIPVLLLHSRLFPDERLRREKELERWLGPPSSEARRPERCIVVGTQVLEQSLDVDFDLMVTDLAPIDLLFQRAGRLFRHERAQRGGGRATPELWLLVPDGEPTEADLGEVGAVYEEHWLRQTLRALEGRRTLEIPTDIESLVEEVYDPTLLPADHPQSAQQIEAYGRSASQRADAEPRLLPHPDLRDDFFGELRASYADDEDPDLHRALRAKTRDGEENVTIVCLDRRGDRLFAGGSSTEPLAVDLDAPPSRALTRALVQRSITVTRPSVVRALRDRASARPESWQRSALLRHRRLVVFEDGAAEVGGVTLRLDPDLGLLLEVPA
jgi:CRISPR-associated endonuclease/helicase Cas3